MADSDDSAARTEVRRVMHDLRQPLAAMQMWLDLLDEALRGQAGEKEQRYLGKLRAEMTRMAGVIASGGSETGATSATPAASVDAQPLRATSDAAASAAAPSQEDDRRLEGIALLLVEDDELTAEALQFALEGEGASVSVAATIAGGLELFENARPAAVLSDIKVSDGDGFTLVREIRRRDQENGRRTVALAVTGFDSDETRAASRAAGFDALVLKPFAIDDLIDLVARSVAATA